MKYKISEDSGASEVIDADNLEEAVEAAKEWASEGEYTERVMVSVYVRGLDEDGEHTDEYEDAEVEAGPEPKEPECLDSEEHDWQAPHNIVGGVKENPGVWSKGGTTLTFHRVCSRCGTHRHENSYGSQRNPGQIDTVSYEAANEE